jgi:hypothetical protein
MPGLELRTVNEPNEPTQATTSGHIVSAEKRETSTKYTQSNSTAIVSEAHDIPSEVSSVSGDKC